MAQALNNLHILIILLNLAKNINDFTLLPDLPTPLESQTRGFKYAI